MSQVQENAVKETNFEFPGQKNFYRGKVRDIYYFDHKMAMVVTDRISAFDVVLPKAIPYKGQVLNQIANEFLHATRDIVKNWVLDMPDPNVTIGLQCDPIPVEMVIRGYLAGHAWREYRDGKRQICGVPLPDGLRENDSLPEPIITPTTKAKTGHDEDISREEILRQGLVDESTYTNLENYTRQLYQRGVEMGEARKLLLVDTKYEFGFYEGEIYLIDEIHTPDSSRYFYAGGYEERQQRGESQKQLSKEFVRQWLIQEGYQGQTGQKIPEMTPEIVNAISERYIELFENLTGKTFIRNNTEDILNRIYQNIINSL